MKLTIHFWIVLGITLGLLVLLAIHTIFKIQILTGIVLGIGILTLIYIYILAIKDMFFTRK